MNFFKIKTTWTNTEFIVFKLCVASIYVLVGAYFHNFVRHYWIPILILFIISMLVTVYLWLHKMKAESKKEKAQ